MKPWRSVPRGAARGRPHATIAVGLIAGALVTLLACGGDGDGDGGPAPTPTPTPVASATPQPTPTMAEAFTIADDLPGPAAVAAAAGGDRYLVTFSVPVAAGGSEVAGVRLDANGTVLDASPLVLSDLGDEPFLAPGATYVPGGIASATSGFGAFLVGYGNVAAGPPGQIVGFVGVPSSGPPTLPATAIDEQMTFSMARTSLAGPVAATSNGTLFLGAYQQILSLVGSFTVSRVIGQIVTTPPVTAQEIGPFSGIVPPPGGLITSGSAPGVATRDDGATLLAWVEVAAPETMPSDTTTRLQGVVLTEAAATPVTLAATETGADGVAVASDGTGFLVVWGTPGQAQQPAALGELRAVRYAPGGEPQPSDGFVVATGSAPKDLVGTVFAGGSWLVAWIEGAALRGALVGATDTVEPIALDPGPVASAALATDGTRVLVVLDRPGADGSSDVLGRFVTLD